MKQQIYRINIRDWEEEIQGIIIDDRHEWISLINLNDYMLDGFSLINRSYVKNIKHEERDIFTENVLLANKRLPTNIKIEVPLNTAFLFPFLMKNKIVFQNSFKEDDYTYIGKVEKCLQNSFYLKKINSRGIWMEDLQLIRINSIRKIEFETDYINSLLTYSEFLYNEILD